MVWEIRSTCFYSLEGKLCQSVSQRMGTLYLELQALWSVNLHSYINFSFNIFLNFIFLCPWSVSKIQLIFRNLKLSSWLTHFSSEETIWRETKCLCPNTLSSFFLTCEMRLSVIRNRCQFLPCPKFHWFLSVPRDSDLIFMAISKYRELCAAITVQPFWTGQFHTSHGALQPILAILWIL